MSFFSRRTLVIWSAGILTSLIIWAPQFWNDDVYNRFNNLVFDAYQLQKPRKWADSGVVVVNIDENSINQIGQWPWPRDYMAAMVDQLNNLGAATIVFDIVFSEKDRTSPINLIDRLKSAGLTIDSQQNTDLLDNDRMFAKAIANARVVTGLVLNNASADDPPPPKAGYGLSGTLPPGFMLPPTKATRNLEIIDNAALGIGLFSLTTEEFSDGIIRKVRLMTGVNDMLYPTLGIEALRVAQGAGGFKIKSSDGSGEVDAGSVRLTSMQVGALVVPTDASGYMPIYHSPAAEKPSIPVHILMKPGDNGLTEQELRSNIEGRIVLIGTSAVGLQDLRSTSIEPVVPGVFVHADIIDQIISGTFLTRPDYAAGAELLASMAAVVILLIITPYVGAIWAGLTALFICLLSVWFFWHLFATGFLLFSPLIVLVSVIAVYLISSTVNYLFSQREEAFLRGAFGQYISPTLVNQLTQNPENLTLGGETKTLTVLFCDIRGFTSMSENLGPTELTNLLNRFLTPMTAILLKNGATIDKYMGDAIMAFWNAPIDQPDHRELACRSVSEFRTALEQLNLETGMDLRIGIGLNTGPSCVGNLGSTQRFSYSAIGDAVNVASRIEGLTKQYGLDNLATGETVKPLGQLQRIEIDLVKVMGRGQPLSIFHIIDDTGFDNDEQHKKLIELHKEFFDSYREGQFDEASSKLAELQKLAPSDLQKLYTIYSDRLAQIGPKPENWDGVFVATEK